MLHLSPGVFFLHFVAVPLLGCRIKTTLYCLVKGDSERDLVLMKIESLFPPKFGSSVCDLKIKLTSLNITKRRSS